MTTNARDEPETTFMHEDLYWLATNVSEWDEEGSDGCGKFTHIRKDTAPDGREFAVFGFGHTRQHEWFSKTQWLQARKDLGLGPLSSEVVGAPKADEAKCKSCNGEGKDRDGYDMLTGASCSQCSGSGLDQSFMTESEEELTAEEWAGSVPDGVEVHDNVNKPKHYQLREGYEVYDLRQDLAAKAANGGATYDQYSDWDRATEYLIRMWGKNKLEDLKKCRWYVNKLIGKLEASDEKH